MEVIECNELKLWLSQPPKYTTFRINALKTFDKSILEEFLKSQSKELGASQIPRYYFVRPDCLVLEQWSDEVTVEKTGMDVIVDAACAAAVLRGAHVFAPGVLGLPIAH